MSRSTDHTDDDVPAPVWAKLVLAVLPFLLAGAILLLLRCAAG